jgi:hypothetical protein
MANSSLQGMTWDIPEELHNHLKRTMNAYRGNQTEEGYQRLRGLIDDKKVGYEQLKRIKNFFDDHSNVDYMSDKKASTPFILNGGNKMKEWVNNTLNTARDNISGGKKIKNQTNMIGNHYQKDSLINKTKKEISINTKNLKQEGIYEIGIMENIISIFNKNKELCQHKQSLQS